MENNSIQDVVSELLTESGDINSQQAVIEQCEQDNSPVDVALLLESLPLTERLNTWEHLSDTMKVPVLVEMRADASTSILNNQNDETMLSLRIGTINRLFGGSQRESRLIGVDTCRRQSAPPRPSACGSASRPRILPGDGLAGALLPLPPVSWTGDAVAAPLTAQPKQGHRGVTPSRRTVPAAVTPGSVAAGWLRTQLLSHPGARESSR